MTPAGRKGGQGMDHGGDDEWTLTVVHEVGHAVVAMHYGAPGRLEFDASGAPMGGCAVERQHEPTGQAGVCYGYAGAAAELLWLDRDGEGGFMGTDEGRFAALGFLASPSPEDFELIGDLRNAAAEIARTKAEFLEACGILRREWLTLAGMVAAIEPRGRGGVYWFAPGTGLLAMLPETAGGEA